MRVPPRPSVLLCSPRERYRIPRPFNTKKDTPLSAVYRMYWAIVMEDTVFLRNEIEYFWTRKGNTWKVHNIPRPPDKEPERLAIISAIPFLLAAAFNRLIQLGLPREVTASILSYEEINELRHRPHILERAAQWAIDAPPLASPLRLPTKDLGAPASLEEDGVDPFMAQKNVLIWRLHIYFT